MNGLVEEKSERKEKHITNDQSISHQPRDKYAVILPHGDQAGERRSVQLGTGLLMSKIQAISLPVTNNSAQALCGSA